MTLIRDIVAELFGMFLADARLTIMVLLLVVLVGGMVDGYGVNTMIGGGVLLAGCLVVLVEAALREARRRR